MARILVSGASGFIGEPLTLFLSSHGHSVVRLPHPYDPTTFDFEGFDAVIHLAGEPLTFTRWSFAKRKKIMESRKQGTIALVEALSKVKHPPKTFLSASAIGFYGDRGEELLTEESKKGKGFLSNVCKAWEEASDSLTLRGTRVIHARFGMVIGANGGALKKMLPIFQHGFGAVLGSGDQWVSWIALDDLILAIDHILFHSKLEGAVNLVSPYTLRQKEFAHILGEAVQKKVFFHIPAWLLRLIFGKDASGLILASARVSPDKILATNFAFHYSDLRSGLFQALKMTL